jgi:hypothetical protein
VDLKVVHSFVTIYIESLVMRYSVHVTHQVIFNYPPPEEGTLYGHNDICPRMPNTCYSNDWFFLISARGTRGFNVSKGRSLPNVTKDQRCESYDENMLIEDFRHVDHRYEFF